MKAKILITGAGGYIGSVATYLLLQHDYEVVAIDNFTTGYRQPLELLQQKYGQDKLRFYDIDLHDDLSPIFEKETGIQAVLHYAASCMVNESMENPQKYFYNNVCGTQNLLETIMRFGIKKIVFSSTCAVYGTAQYVPIDENHPTNPDSPYGYSKRMMEQIMMWYSQLQGLHAVILRYFNVCGASDDGLVGDSKKPSSLLIQNAVRGALGIEPFFITAASVNTPDGTPIRDYINVVDLNEAHLAALDYLLKGGKSEIINLGTGTGNSVLEIINKVQEITGVKFDFKRAEARKGESDKMIAATGKAKQLLGWEPKRSIADSVKALVIWYKAHPNGWEK